jgi:hypothetical protein
VSASSSLFSTSIISISFAKTLLQHTISFFFSHDVSYRPSKTNIYPITDVLKLGVHWQSPLVGPPVVSQCAVLCVTDLMEIAGLRLDRTYL